MSSYQKIVIKLSTSIVALYIILVLVWDSSILSTKSPFYGLAKSQFKNYSSKAVNENWKAFLPNNASGLEAYISPFYGMNYQHSYGLARSHFKKYSTKAVNKNWKTFFPKTLSALKALLIKNPSLKSDFYTKSFSVSLPKNNYYFGDEFTATIMSRDSNGNQKTFGGDYYRARLIRDNSSYPDGIPCRVTDNEDGSYTVKAPLVLNGRLTLEVVLVIPIEEVHEILEQTKDKPWWGYLFTAELESGEKVLCNTNFSKAIEAQDIPLCDYSNPRNDEPWFCVKPTSNYCSKILTLEYNSYGIASVINFTEICITYGCYKKNQNQTIAVQLLEQKASTIDQLELSLPSCQNEFATSRTEKPFTGYFNNGTWKTLFCKNSYNSIQQTKSCFKNKIVYFIGDSTIRQFFYLYVETLGLNVSGPSTSKIWQQPRVAYENLRRSYNTTMYYRAHGPPLLNPGPPNTRPYISDSITDLPLGGDNVYVIFNIGAHLFHYDPNMYIHRLNGIRHAILRHHEQFPDTKFIVRGLNVVELPFEWNIFRFEKILFETFRSLRNVVYLNLWDLTTVWPHNDYHPRDHVLREQALFMTQYICS